MPAAVSEAPKAIVPLHPGCLFVLRDVAPGRRPRRLLRFQYCQVEDVANCDQAIVMSKLSKLSRHFSDVFRDISSGVVAHERPSSGRAIRPRIGNEGHCSYVSSEANESIKTGLNCNYSLH